MAQEPQAPGIDTAARRYALDQIRSEQNLLMGIVAGAAAALLGAGLWAAVTVVTGYQIGWMAVGIGFLVGLAVRTMGKGIDRIFGIAGSALSLLGCLVGNLLAVCGMVSSQEGIPFMDAIAQTDLNIAIELMAGSFSPIDLLFYGIAAYEGYKLSIRQISEQELAPHAQS